MSLGIGQAAALGAPQGPAELLPVSSSGHLALAPALVGWDYGGLDPELRKSFEVALHAGTAAALAIAQIAAGLALGLADLRPADRSHADAGPLDHLVIGCGQATALVPGVSRNGATLTAARLLRFERGAASVLSRHAALPVIAGATGLKGLRLARRGLAPELRTLFAIGAGAAFASTLASRRLIGVMDRARGYLPIAAYRVTLGGAALRRLRAR